MDDTGLQAVPPQTNPPSAPSFPQESPVTPPPAAEPVIPPTPTITPPPPINQPPAEIQPETPQVTPPPSPVKKSLKKNGFKIAGGLLMVALVIGGVFASKQLTMQQQTVESQAVKNKNKSSCHGCSNGGWLVWRNGECKRTGICGNTNNSDKNTEDPNVDQKNNAADCEEIGGFWCGVAFDAKGKKLDFCKTKDIAGSCKDIGLTKGYVFESGDCSTVGANPQVFYCKKGTNENMESCERNDPLPAGAGWAGGKIVGSYCGVIQVDTTTYGGGYCSRWDESGCNQQNENPPSSPSPSPSPSPTMACVDLTKGTTTPKKGDKVTFTCEGSMSGVSPVAFFRSSTDNGTTFGSAVPAGGVAVNASTKKASYDITIDTIGNWVVQCRVCTTAAAATCTAWGQAN